VVGFANEGSIAVCRLRKIRHILEITPRHLIRKAPPLLSPRAAKHGPVFLLHLPCFFSYCATNPAIVFEVEFPLLRMSASELYGQSCEYPRKYGP
jgi:hypothetical protein